jgi:uncharacterized protein YndB with AHSA1/START domain
MMDDGSTDGTVTRDGDGLAVIRFERHLPYPVEVVWSALTEPQRLLRWWGEVDIDPRAGGRFDLTWLNPSRRGSLHHARHHHGIRPTAVARDPRRSAQ